VDSEPKRRFVLRLVTSLLTRIIGPVFAWNAWDALGWGALGLLLYAIVHTIAKWTLANIAKRNPQIANIAYRHAPAALCVASIACIASQSFDPSPLQLALFSAIALPILLGGYEGAYWVSFHGVDAVRFELRTLDLHRQEANISEGQYERLEKHPMTLDYDRIKWEILGEKKVDLPPREDDFLNKEIIATIAACILIILVTEGSSVDWKFYAGVIAFILAGAAWHIPIDQSMLHDGTLRRKDRAPLSNGETGLRHRLLGKSITGAYGMMQISVTWAMRFFALSTGDVSHLVVFITIAEVLGWCAPKLIKRIRGKRGEQQESEFDQQVWNLAHLFVVLGALIMGYSMRDYNVAIFIIGWALAQSAIRGATRGLELKFANRQYLSPRYEHWPEPNFLIEEVGIRERMKFSQQLMYVGVWIICYPLLLLLPFSETDWMIYVLLFWTIVMALTGFRLGQQIWLHPQDLRKDSFLHPIQ